jgi:hypothetical protein
MRPDLEPLLKNLPPRTKAALVQAINACSKQLNMAPDWVQRWLSFTVVADALTRYAAATGALFEIKGGAAIEMRMRRLNAGPEDVTVKFIQPRATRDLDATFRGEWDALQRAVEAAFAETHLGFTFRAEAETPNAPFMRRFRVRVAYLEKGVGGVRAPRDLNSVMLEVSRYEGTHYPAEMVSAFSLKPFGIEGPSDLPCLPLSKQIAQKIHAVTEVPDNGRSNERFRDLLDLVMLSVLAPPSPHLRAVCEETFTIRAKQSWPPAIVARSGWVEPLEQSARGMGLSVTTAEDIVEHVASYVGQIATSV